MTILLAYLIKTHNVRVLISFEILTKPLWKLKIKICSHWVPIFLVYFASGTRAKINKMSICRYHKDAIINCVFKIIATLTSLLVYKPNFTVLRQILTIIIIAEYGILAYRNIFQIEKV